MPRLQVYLPDDLYHELKARNLPASKLLQKAIRSEIRKQLLQKEFDDYLAELAEEVGEPTPEERAEAEALVRRITRHQSKLAG